MAKAEIIGRLEALLARIQERAAEPRVARAPRFTAKPISEPPLAEPTIAHFAEPEPEPERVTEPEVMESEVEEVAIEVAEPVFATPEPVPVPEPEEQPPVTVGAHVPEYREPQREEVVEAISGEFAVAEVPMELEELGPADEEEVVHDIHISAPMKAAPPISEPAPPPPVPEVERTEQPPESGRELVAAPHESARMAVAAPATPDPNALELLTEEHAPPPESSRNLKVAPATPQTSDVFDLEPPVRVEPGPPPLPFAPEKLVDIVRPVVMAADVAAYIEASRSPRPETFGVLLDAALDL